MPAKKKALATTVVSKAVPEVAAAQVAGEQLAGVGQAVVKAATTPIYSRKRTEVWDRETETWVPVEREREVNVSPAAVAVAALVGVATAAVVQRGLRTGTLGTKRQIEVIGTLGQAKSRRIWVGEDAPLPAPRTGPGGTEVFTVTGRVRNAPTIRTRDSLADYQPFVRGV